MSGQPLHREGREGRSTHNMTNSWDGTGRQRPTGAFTLSTHRHKDSDAHRHVQCTFRGKDQDVRMHSEIWHFELSRSLKQKCMYNYIVVLFAYSNSFRSTNHALSEQRHQYEMALAMMLACLHKETTAVQWCVAVTWVTWAKTPTPCTRPYISTGPCMCYACLMAREWLCLREVNPIVACGSFQTLPPT